MNARQKENYKNYYEIEKVIGASGFSNVYKGSLKETNELRAIKVISLENMKQELLIQYDKEKARKKLNVYVEEFILGFEIMKICSNNNNNSVKCYEYFINEDEFVIIMELCDQNLSKLLRKRISEKGHGFSSEEIYEIMKQLNNTFKIMYKNNIAHRDLSLENIIIKYIDIELKNYIIKLSGYGQCIRLTSLTSQYWDEIIGTLLYMAPEILNEEKCNYKCDLWSLGIIIYELIFGETPYKGKIDLAVYNNIKRLGKKALKKSGNEELDDLIDHLLEANPDKRITWEEYFNHPFFKEKNKINLEYKLKKDEINKDSINLENNVKEEEEQKKDENNKDSINLGNNMEGSEAQEKDEINIIYNFAKNLISIMEIPNAYIPDDNKEIDKIKIANIIYYDENIKKHADSIHKDADILEKKTSGAFIFCTHLISLNLVIEEIKEYNEKVDKNAIFNLIVTGRQFQKVMDNLIENDYEYLFQNICIYCMKVEKYLDLSKQYPKIKGIYNNIKQVINFIENVSSDKI